eukprot:jgi/Tetstr1/436991/TSEL_025763.t1
MARSSGGHGGLVIVGWLPLLLLIAALTAVAAAATAPGYFQTSVGSQDSAVDTLTKLALQGRAGDINVWFDAHPGSCINRKRLISVAERPAGMGRREQAQFWSLRRPDKGGTSLQVTDAEMERYQLLKALRSGREGDVALALDKQSGKMVAIKKVQRVFAGRSGVRAARQIWTEIKLLQLTRDSGDIMDMERVLMPREPHLFQNVYQVYGLLQGGIPLYKADQSLTPAEAQQQKLNFFQLIRGLHYMHSAGVVHNDFREHNTMLDADCNLKIIDLGLGRLGVKTRSTLRLPLSGDFSWYARDMWMLGSSMLYIIGGAGQFRLASGHATQREKAGAIIDVLGAPSEAVINMYDERMQGIWRDAKKKHRQRMSLQERFPHADPLLLDLIQRTMTLDRRPPRPSELLQHPYFDGMDRSDIPHGPAGASDTVQDFPTSHQRARAKLMRAVHSVNAQYARSRIDL